MKLLAIIGATTALTCGMAASAAPVARAPMLSFTISPGVSDSGLKPLGGGICLSNKRVTDPKADGGIAWSPDGSRIAFFRQTGPLTADVFVADADGSHLHNLTNGSSQFSWAPTGLPTDGGSSTSPGIRPSNDLSWCGLTGPTHRSFPASRSIQTISCEARGGLPTGD